ncbi:MAG TPA: DNA-processing protein DprA [Patescibacteria group bacterium]|jgi:DNA processing protein|nr:DNA-processing protein DprA [Patescibacteria group bacterium]
MTHYDDTIDLEPLYLYILSLLPVRQLKIFERWREAAGSFEAIYLASEKQLAEFGLGLELIIKLRQIKTEHSIEKLALSLQSTAVNTVMYDDPQYPSLLKEIHDPPPVLFYRGQLGAPDEACVAIVGSRSMSTYGSLIMPRITTPLIKAGVTIVSGMALGIDGAAHAQSVKATTRTIAVLGGGVDEASVYPRGHYKLAQQILDCGGLLISEQPPGTPGLRHHFIARNRIIAGLSLGVVIVECKIKSGALLTADYAADFNRALYAVPGPAYSSLSEGPHNLIRSGACLVTKGEEILEDLALALPKVSEKIDAARKNSFTENELLVLKFIYTKPATADAIAELTKLDTQTLMQTLSMLEVRNEIKNLGSEGFIKTS